MVELAGDCGVCGRVAAGFIPRWSRCRGSGGRRGGATPVSGLIGSPLAGQSRSRSRSRVRHRQTLASRSPVLTHVLLLYLYSNRVDRNNLLYYAPSLAIWEPHKVRSEVKT